MAINREMIGRPLSPTTFEVDRGKIREFASATGDENPIYHDVEAAKEAGYNDLPIPPTFPTTFSFWGKRAKDAPVEDLGFPFARVLHGEEEYTYLAPIYPGDILTGVRTLTNVEEKQGRSGSMEIVTSETVYKNQHGEEVLRARTVAVIR
jgi:acyl dehydratase